MKTINVVQVASEMVPFAKTGGLADVCGALPLALEKLGQDVIIVMPGYKAVHNLKQPAVKRLNEGISISRIGKNINVYFIDNDEYFNRDSLYGEKTGDYKDNLDRFSYFCRKALELLKELGFKADIIHCHDWQSALIPIYLKTLYAEDDFYKDTKTIFTIHNIGYQGLFPKAEFPKLGLSWNVFNMEMLEYFDKINILKGGIVFSDLINTVSETYSKEIQTSQFGFGMEGVLNKRRDSVFGIINGLDYSIWDPSRDKKIFQTYSFKNIKDKYANKDQLQQISKLPVKRTVPLLGIVSRLAEQKGFDILSEGIDAICKMDLQLIILGTGDLKYHQILEQMVKKYPKVISLSLKFDDTLAHRIYAGADIFLMPSKYEPCGLGQMISLRYGTLPLVFKTGGLADTVNEKNGFVFDKYSKDELIKTIKKAIKVYKDKIQWNELMLRGMKLNFSWAESAKKYIELYERAKGK